MAHGGERGDFIEERPSAGDDQCAAPRVVGAGGWWGAERVGAVERIVQAAPARVGGVERVARVRERHDELWPGGSGDLGIDALGLDLECHGGGFEIADLAQEGFVGVRGGENAVLRDPPLVDRGLQAGAGGEEFGIARGEAAEQVGESGQEGRGIDVQAGEDIVHEEGVERGSEFETGGGGIWHEGGVSG